MSDTSCCCGGGDLGGEVGLPRVVGLKLTSGKRTSESSGQTCCWSRTEHQEDVSCACGGEGGGAELALGLAEQLTGCADPVPHFTSPI